ncbi:MAG TPA: EVE domain-containing protein, partial [Thermomicrobiales bacterium]|nr:EVE domain-containing protein [Thermomicrobiales bacterium]
MVSERFDRMPSYWINTVSLEHVQRGVEGGFTQANHGRPTTLRRLARGDLVVFYSPRTAYPDGEPLQCFTALGRVADDAPYQAEMTPTFRPWRRRTEFLRCQEAPIRDLVGALAFIPDPKRWGYPFRRGLFQIGEEDFRRIADAMRTEI